MLRSLTLNEAEEWDRIVHSFPEYDVYYLSGYTKGLQRHGDGEPLLIFYDGGDLRGISVMMKRRISEDAVFSGKLQEEWYDLITPYGYGGWLFAGSGDVGELMAQYDSWCRKNRIVSEFVRFHPQLNNQEAVREYYEVTSPGSTVSMDLASCDVIWSNLSSKNRNMVRKGQKSGSRVYRSNSPQIYQTFREIYNLTMDKDHADAYYYFETPYYESMCSDLRNHAQVFYAQTEDGQIAAAAIILRANGRLHYHLSGSRTEFQRMAPTNLLLYEAACWGSENGCRSFHLGGGIGAREDSLFAFKKAFNRGAPCHFHVGKRIVNQEAYEMLVNLKGGEKHGDFFPAYRG